MDDPRLIRCMWMDFKKHAFDQYDNDFYNLLFKIGHTFQTFEDGQKWFLVG
jgi:hypothetical protein